MICTAYILWPRFTAYVSSSSDAASSSLPVVCEVGAVSRCFWHELCALVPLVGRGNQALAVEGDRSWKKLLHWTSARGGGFHKKWVNSPLLACKLGAAQGSKRSSAAVGMQSRNGTLVARSYIKREEGEETFAAGLSAGCHQQLSWSIPHCCEIPELRFVVLQEENLPSVFDAFQPQVCVICSRVEFSAALCPKLFRSRLRREGKGGGEIRLFQFLPFQGLQDCLSKTVILLLWQLPLELQSQHLVSLLLVAGRGFFSFFLFLSFLFHTLFPSTFTMQWESQGNEKGAAHLWPFHRKDCVCLSCVCYGYVSTRKPKTMMVDFFFPKVSV